LRRLFSLCWQRGMVFVMTSNRPPSQLYLNGIQRDLFMTFIDELQVGGLVLISLIL
jgi:predicted ATPase